jgi:hypothetical protein
MRETLNRIHMRNIITLAMMGAYLAQIFTGMIVDDKFFGVLIGCLVWYGYKEVKDVG